MYIDSRTIKKIKKKDCRLDNMEKILAGASLFSLIDLGRAYHQIPSQEMSYCFEEALGNWLDEGSPWSAVSLEEVC